MIEYHVNITPEAEADMENLWGYIAYELENPSSAYKIVDDLYMEIAKLNLMPKRFRIIDREPWKSRGVRFMFVDNYRVHYVVDDTANSVTVLRIFYVRSDS